MGKYPLAEINHDLLGILLKQRTDSHFDFDLRQRFDIDINETTTEGYRAEDIERMHPDQVTVAYYEVKVECGGMYD